MPNNESLTIYFHRSDGEPERVPLAHGTMSEAVTAIHTVFYISEGLYTVAEIYRGSELIEKVEKPLRSRSCGVYIDPIIAGSKEAPIVA